MSVAFDFNTIVAESNIALPIVGANDIACGPSRKWLTDVVQHSPAKKVEEAVELAGGALRPASKHQLWGQSRVVNQIDGLLPCRKTISVS